MTNDEIRSRLLAAIGEIAPETDLTSIDPARALRPQVDLDSADWLNFLVAVHEMLGVDIPDTDAARLRTVDELTAFCASRLEQR